jgi:hypothetical protein
MKAVTFIDRSKKGGQIAFVPERAANEYWNCKKCPGLCPARA